LKRIGINLLMVSEKLGGAGRYGICLIDALQKVDKKNKYFLFVNKKIISKFKLFNDNFQIIPVYVPFNSRFYRILYEQLFLSLIVKKLDLDVIHFISNIIPIINKINRKTMTILTVHDLLFIEDPKRYPLLKYIYYKIFVLKSICQGDRIITVAKTNKQKIKAFRQNDVVVIYHAADVKFRCLNVEKTDRILLFSTIEPGKNIEFIIQSLPHYRIMIIGRTGWKYAKFRKLIRKNKNIEYKGYIKDRDLVRAINRARLVIYPSCEEGFGLPVLESLSCGTPVIANDITVLRELFGNNIYYFKYPDKKQLIKQIKYIFSLNQYQYLKLQKKCINYSKRFTWQRLAKETLKVYLGDGSLVKENCPHYKYQKVLFCNPPYKKGFSRSSRFPSVTRSGTLYYPIWLCYAAAYLKKQGIEIKIIDAIADNWSITRVLSSIIEYSPDIIVIDTSFASIKSDIRHLEFLKVHYSSCLYILSGCQTTAEPEKVLKMSDSIDAVLIGEYENIIMQICEGKNLAGIHGVGFKNNKGKIIINKKRNIVRDLDTIPFVSSLYKEHLNIRSYRYGITLMPVVTILTSRGCPYQCSFCLWPRTITKGGLRTRSPDNIVQEFLFIKKELPYVKEIFIEDDTFNYKKNRVKDICKALIKAGNQIKWTCNVRVDLSYNEMKLMKKAGCRLVVAGFESGTQKVLNRVQKKIKLQQSFEFMKNAHRAGLLVHGCFILGLPGDNEKSIQRTIDLSIALEPDTAQFDPLFVIPGIGIYTENIGTPDINSRVLKYARRKFYLRLPYIFRVIGLMIRDPFTEGRRIIRTFFRFIKYFF